MQVICTVFRSKANIRKILGSLKAHSLARKVGAMKRKGRKCSVIDYLMGFWLACSSGHYSYDLWAGHISRITGKAISGQAICKRTGCLMVVCLKAMLKKTFRKKYASLCDQGLLGSFSNVYVQDATHFSLPGCLSKVFPGSFSKNGDRATAKVQATFNLSKGLFSDFLLTSFRKNDQRDAPRIVEKLNKGALIIRDLGYFTLKSLNRITQRSAHFLTRYRFGISIYDTSGEPIDLLKYLKKQGAFDQWVEIGIKTKVPCRLVAVPLPDKVVNEKKRKARKDRNKKANHNQEYIELLGYNIYITTVSADLWSANQVARAYRCRWYIEILFKAWKSALKIKINIPERHITQSRAEFFFYASLLMVNILIMPVFSTATAKSKADLSILKTCSFILSRLYEFLTVQNLDQLIDQLLYFGHYEKRRSRNNAIFYLNGTPC